MIWNHESGVNSVESLAGRASCRNGVSGRVIDVGLETAVQTSGDSSVSNSVLDRLNRRT
ncbi:hypothetical protein BC2230_30822 [Burkholderia cepacia]